MMLEPPQPASIEASIAAQMTENVFAVKTSLPASVPAECDLNI
jgi:hypothetical protein